MWVVFAYVVFGVRFVACGVSGGALREQADSYQRVLEFIARRTQIIWPGNVDF